MKILDTPDTALLSVALAVVAAKGWLVKPEVAVWSFDESGTEAMVVLDAPEDAPEPRGVAVHCVFSPTHRRWVQRSSGGDPGLSAYAGFRSSDQSGADIEARFGRLESWMEHRSEIPVVGEPVELTIRGGWFIAVKWGRRSDEPLVDREAAEAPANAPDAPETPLPMPADPADSPQLDDDSFWFERSARA